MARSWWIFVEHEHEHGVEDETSSQGRNSNASSSVGPFGGTVSTLFICRWNDCPTAASILSFIIGPHSLF